MLSRERVARVIRHEKPDRIPIYGWVRANLEEPVTERYGSVEAFEDHYEFDFAHLFGGPSPYADKALAPLREARGGIVEPADLLDVPLTDPNNSDAYASLAEQVRHHQTERGRFVYVQTPGIFECLNGAFGIENHLGYLALFEDDLHAVYRRQAEWNRAFAENCIDLGIDMVHVSDDWGGQTGPLFSPAMWDRLIRPYHAITCRAVKARGAFLSLHTDGNVVALLDRIVALGYDVLHPFQESAGMPLTLHKERYADAFVVMGGLDVQTTIGFGKPDFLKAEIERVLSMYAEGGLLFCTSHFVQDHCTIDELTLAFDLAYDLSRKVCQA